MINVSSGTFPPTAFCLFSFLQTQWWNRKVSGPVFMAQIIHVIIFSTHINFFQKLVLQSMPNLWVLTEWVFTVVQVLQFRCAGKCVFSPTCSALSLGTRRCGALSLPELCHWWCPAHGKSWNPFLLLCLLHFSAWGHLPASWGCPGYQCVTERDTKEPWGTPLLDTDTGTTVPGCIHPDNVQNAQKMRWKTVEEWSYQQSYFLFLS